MAELLRYIQTEWATLVSAPLTFMLFGILAFGAAFFIARWRYEGIGESLRERIDTLKDRIQGKDEQINEYRERLHLIPADATSYSRLTNNELQQRALKVVTEVREFLRERGERQYRSLFSGWRRGITEMTEDQKRRAWEEETNALMQDSLQTSTAFDARFKVDTILLRDELLSRLPSTAKNQREYGTYEHPTNPIGMGMVADDLERLAKSIPLATISARGA